MKRKRFAAITSATLWVCMAFAFTACEGENGGEGDNGADNVGSDNLEICLQGHLWDEGVVTTPQTCITPGVVTYTCLRCGELKKDLLDADGVSHLYRYEYDDMYHWGVCALCGDVSEKHVHDFGDGDSEEKVCADCGYVAPLSDYGYMVVFAAEHAKIFVYKTQDYSAEGTETTVAYSRDSLSGALTKSGDGQVNFFVSPDLGYEVEEIAVGGTYKNLKDSADTGVENMYRITKIQSDLTVTVTTKIQPLDLPIIEIDTENGAEISSKEVYLSASVSVSNADETYCFEAAGAQLRGRGNTSWEMPKKSYRLKFNSKTDLFGNGSAKNWTLIANYGDPSLLRNYLAYNMANDLLHGLDYTTTTQNVEFYLNGEYMGVYLVCEQNEVGSTRVNIDASLTDDEGIIKADTGYFLESDHYVLSEGGVENLDYVSVNGQIYAIKSPDVDDEFYLEHHEIYASFIKNKLQTAIDAINLPDTPENYRLIRQCIDVDSFLDGYILDELFHLGDLEYTSFYLYYDSNDGLLHRGCVWDYDFSSGNLKYHEEACAPDTLWAVNISWYNGLLKHGEFLSAVSERLQTLKANNCLESYLSETIDRIYASEGSFERNFERWNVLGIVVWETSTTDEIAAIDTWVGQVEYLRSWLLESLDYMVSVYCEETSET